MGRPMRQGPPERLFTTDRRLSGLQLTGKGQPSVLPKKGGEKEGQLKSRLREIRMTQGGEGENDYLWMNPTRKKSGLLEGKKGGSSSRYQEFQKNIPENSRREKKFASISTVGGLLLTGRKFKRQ